MKDLAPEVQMRLLEYAFTQEPPACSGAASLGLLFVGIALAAFAFGFWAGRKAP